MPSNRRAWKRKKVGVANDSGNATAAGRADIGQVRSGRQPLRLLLTVGILLSLALPFSAAAPEKRLSVYSTVANYSLPIMQRQGRDYIGLLELLEPLGTVSAKSEGPRWRLHYNNVLGDFTVGKITPASRDATPISPPSFSWKMAVVWSRWPPLIPFCLVFWEGPQICTRNLDVSSSATSAPTSPPPLPTLPPGFPVQRAGKSVRCHRTRKTAHDFQP